MFQSNCEALNESFIQAIQKADGFELLHFLSFLDFREKGDNAIVQSLDIKSTLMEVFNNNNNQAF
jgi:hypothetical protein